MDEMIGRPWARYLHLAIPQGGAGGSELVVVALHALAIDQMRNVQHHLAAFGKPAADFLIQWIEEPVHLEADRPRTRLALPLPHGVLSETGQIFAAHSLGRQMFGDLTGATIVHKDLQVHFGLAAQHFNIG